MSGYGAYAAPNWANAQRVGDVGTKATLMLLAAYADENYSCYPGQERLADESEQSVRTVRRQLDVLEEVGLIRREARYVYSEATGKRARTSDRFLLQLGITVTKDDVKAAVDRIASGESGKQAAKQAKAPTAAHSTDLPDKSAGRSTGGPTGHSGGTYRSDLGGTPATSDRVTPSGSPSGSPRNNPAADATGGADALPRPVSVNGARRATAKSVDTAQTAQLTLVDDPTPASAKAETLHQASYEVADAYMSWLVAEFYGGVAPADYSATRNHAAKQAAYATQRGGDKEQVLALLTELFTIHRRSRPTSDMVAEAVQDRAAGRPLRDPRRSGGRPTQPHRIKETWQARAAEAPSAHVPTEDELAATFGPRAVRRSAS